jgi:hypothetical protein
MWAESFDCGWRTVAGCSEYGTQLPSSIQGEERISYTSES